MLAKLTRRDRQLTELVTLPLAALGLLIAFAARGDPMAVHGVIITLFALGLFLLVRTVRTVRDAPEPPASQLESYYDDPSKVGLVLALVWGVIGMAVGD